MTWHPEILSLQQQRVLAQLGPLLKRRGFFLAGGTALALPRAMKETIRNWLREVTR